MAQQPPIQLLQLVTCFYENENFYYALMYILKYIWDSPLEYIDSLFNIFCNTNIIFKKSYSILIKKFGKQHKCSYQ